MSHERCSPGIFFVGSAREFFCLIVAEGSRVGIYLGDVWVRQELPICAPEDAPCVGCDVDESDMLTCLSSACGGGVEACFDRFVLSG